MILKRVYVNHYDIEGNPIDVITCSNCGHQVRKEDGKGVWSYDRDIKCCESSSYYYGIVVPVTIDKK